MLTNTGSERVRSVRSLGRRSVRDREHLFLVEGPQAVREVIAYRPEVVRDLYFAAPAAGEQTTRQSTLLDAAQAAGLAIREVSHEVLGVMSDALAPQGVIAVCRPVDVPLATVLDERPRLLMILTNVRDPGNAGTVIRSADAAGADAVLLSDSSVDIYNPKVVRSTVGSLFHLPLVTGLPVGVMLEQVRASGLALLAADASADKLLGDLSSDPGDLTDLLSRSHAWVMGNEAWGLDPEVRAACDTVVRVPLYGKAESLNLAMAATLCLYQSAGVQRKSPGVR